MRKIVNLFIQAFLVFLCKQQPVSSASVVYASRCEAFSKDDANEERENREGGVCMCPLLWL